MKKLISLLTFLPAVLSVNLLSINCYSSELSDGIKTDETKVNELVNTAKEYAKSKNIDLESFRDRDNGPTMGSKFNGGSLADACRLVSGQYSSLVNEMVRKNVNTKSLKVDLAIVAILIERITSGGKISFDNGVAKMVYALNMYAQGWKKNKKEYRLKDDIKGIQYLTAAVLQEILIKMSTTGSACLNECEYEDCINKVVDYLRKNSKEKFESKNSEGREVNLNLNVQTMISDGIKMVIGEFYQCEQKCEIKKGQHQRSTDTKKTEYLENDISRRVLIKNYIRKCAFDGIKRYAESSKGALDVSNDDTHKTLFNSIKTYAENEKQLFDSMFKLQQLAKERASVVNAVLALEDEDGEIKKKVLSAAEQSTGNGKVKFQEILIRDDSFNDLKQYATGNKAIGIAVGDTYKRIDDVKYTNLNSPNVTQKTSKVSKLGIKMTNNVIKKHNSVSKEQSTQFELQMQKLCNSDIVSAYVNYHKIINDLFGNDLSKFNVHEAIKLLELNLIGAAILNSFTFAGEGEMYSLIDSIKYNLGEITVGKILNFATNRLNSIVINKGNLNYDRHWQYERLVELVQNVKKACPKISDTTGEGLSEIPESEFIKNSGSIYFLKCPVYFCTYLKEIDLTGKSGLASAQSGQNKLTNKVDDDLYNIKVCEIMDTMDSLKELKKKYETKDSSDVNSKIFGQYKALASIKAWVKMMDTSKTFGHNCDIKQKNILPLLSLKNHYDEEEKVGDVLKNIVQWSVMYNGLMFPIDDVSKSNVNEKSWLKNPKVNKMVRDSLLPIFDILNGQGMNYIDMYGVCLDLSKGITDSKSNNIDYNYLMVDEKMEKERLGPLKMGNDVPDEKWKDWNVTLYSLTPYSMRYSMKINRLDWNKICKNPLIIITNEGTGEKILAYD